MLVKLYLALALVWMSWDMNAQHLSKKNTVKLLALGDSYTIGESVAEVQRWPVQLIHALRKKGFTCDEPDIIAVTGWRTDDLKNGIQARKPGTKYNLVSLLIGVNNQYQGRSLSQYETEFSELLEFAIRHAGGNAENVFVLSIPDYGYTPFGKSQQKEISPQIDSFNAVNSRITRAQGVTYINVTDISRMGLDQPELVAEDGLHPSGDMYALWVERILQSL